SSRRALSAGGLVDHGAALAPRVHDVLRVLGPPPPSQLGVTLSTEELTQRLLAPERQSEVRALRHPQHSPVRGLDDLHPVGCGELLHHASPPSSADNSAFRASFNATTSASCVTPARAANCHATCNSSRVAAAVRAARCS